MSDWDIRTKLVHEGVRRSQYGEMSEAIFLTQGFVYDSAEQAEARFIEVGPDEYIYGRYANPTVRMFEERIALIEGTEDAFATASGMAAVSGALISLCKAGDRVVAARALFGSCLYVLDLLARYGVTVELVDGTDLDQWARAVTPGTRLVFFESVSNPTLEVIDIGAVARIAHAAGALVVVDNVFATPIFSRAVAQGADVVVYSATKHIDGGGRCLGGVICASRELIRKTIEPCLKHLGPSMSPFNAWVLLKGMETLDLRVRAQTDSALAVADLLSRHPKVARVMYPGLPSDPHHARAMEQMGAGGTVVSFEVAGGQPAAFRFLNALRIVKISNNLGDAKSIATHPATTTHQRLPADQKALLGITPGLIRLSLGIEATRDLVTDISAALDA